MPNSDFFIFSYGKFKSLNPGYKDPLINSIGIWNLDYWSLLHFFWYGGYIYPSCALPVLGLGFAWEGFEHFMGILGGFEDCPENVNVKNNEKRWYGCSYKRLILILYKVLKNYLEFFLPHASHKTIEITAPSTTPALA